MNACLVLEKPWEQLSQWLFYMRTEIATLLFLLCISQITISKNSIVRTLQTKHIQTRIHQLWMFPPQVVFPWISLRCVLLFKPRFSSRLNIEDSYICDWLLHIQDISQNSSYQELSGQCPNISVQNTLDRNMAPVPFWQWPEFPVYRMWAGHCRLEPKGIIQTLGMTVGAEKWSLRFELIQHQDLILVSWGCG